MGTAHFPQDVDIETPQALAQVVGPLNLGNAAFDGKVNQLLMAVPAGAAMIDLRDDVADLVKKIGIDRGHRSNAAGVSPRARRVAAGNGNALAPFDQGQDFLAGKSYRVQCLQTVIIPFCPAPLRAGTFFLRPRPGAERPVFVDAHGQAYFATVIDLENPYFHFITFFYHIGHLFDTL